MPPPSRVFWGCFFHTPPAPGLTPGSPPGGTPDESSQSSGTWSLQAAPQDANQSTPDYLHSPKWTLSTYPAQIINTPYTEHHLLHLTVLLSPPEPWNIVWRTKRPWPADVRLGDYHGNVIESGHNNLHNYCLLHIVHHMIHGIQVMWL